jgi:Protein of unknown function (DUF3443)
VLLVLRRSALLAVALVAVFVTLAGCTSTAAGNDDGARVVPLEAAYPPVSGPLQRYGLPVVDVKVGRGKPIPVFLDTGSVGLRIIKGFVPRGPHSEIVQGNREDRASFGLPYEPADMTLDGPLASARVTLGRVQTQRPVPIQIVDSITCTSSTTTCASTHFGPGAQGVRADGILGVGLSGPSPGDPVVNPLLDLPKPYSTRWTIDIGNPITVNQTGRLVLGSPGPPHPSLTLKLAPGPQSRESWYEWPTVCWMIQGVDPCVPTTFDSGSQQSAVESNGLGVLPSSNPRVPKDWKVVSLLNATGSAPIYSFTTDDDDGAVWLQSSHQSLVDVGVPVFYAFSFTYDPVKGEILISPS